MNKRIFTGACVTAVAIGILLLIFSSLSSTADISVRLSDDDFANGGNAVSKEVEVSQWSNLLTLYLSADHSTGFEWELTDVTDLNTLRSTGNSYLEPDTGRADGQEVWTFDVRKSGTSTISMEYRQHESDMSDVLRTIDITVVAR